ncbi:hypothetical protein C1645_195300 [Glomus cerebriforme]|uniref:Uncharacterized protein n=1 Tax=Glomus cerebriforme TaxID=658196 RepID=A0A397TNE9_9GLOM|nr:hypothetical protein C1645_195300 [Glomus cerebriforme]
MMIKCGYFLGGNIDPTKLIAAPDEFDKINLTPSRSKFIVLGTKDEIFEWLEHYEYLVCKYDQEFDPKPPLRHNHTMTNVFKLSSMRNLDIIISFKLYYDEENLHDHHHRHHVVPHFLKNLFGAKRYQGSSKMRLEIEFCDHNNSLPSENVTNQTPIMEAEGKNGVKLSYVLNKWKLNLNKSKSRSTCDFE